MAGQGVAVGAQARRGEADEHVAEADALGPELGAALEDADGEAGDVEVVGAHDPAVLGGLATKQGTAGLTAALGHAADDLGDAIRVDRADGHVVEQEERLGTDAHEVVDAHGHEVDPHRVEAVGEAGHLELGAHAVGGGHEDRVRGAGEVEGEQAAEAADAAEDLRSGRRGHHVLDRLDGGVAGRDVDPGRGIGGSLLLGHGSDPRERRLEVRRRSGARVGGGL